MEEERGGGTNTCQCIRREFMEGVSNRPWNGFLEEAQELWLCSMLNFGFFQPMTRRKDYSVGVFYLATLNLPRAEQFKWENIIVIGIVPSLDCEPKDLNEFLEPAVDELKALWKGIRLKSSLGRFALVFRAAVMCVSSDVPAT